MTIKMERDLIHFGRHYLPIDTAQKFWVLEQIGTRGPGIQIEHVSHDQPDKRFTYQIYTTTIENAYKLGMELLLHTNASLCAGFKDLNALFLKNNEVYFPFIEVQFWSDLEKQTFNALLTSTLFPSKQFFCQEGAKKIQFIAREGGKKWSQVVRMRTIFGQICHLTADREFESLMQQNLTGSGIDGLNNRRERGSPSFLVTSDHLYVISFSNGRRNERRLHDASIIFLCAGEKKR